MKYLGWLYCYHKIKVQQKNSMSEGRKNIKIQKITDKKRQK